jgi:hypothetical protein
VMCLLLVDVRPSAVSAQLASHKLEEKLQGS